MKTETVKDFEKYPRRTRLKCTCWNLNDQGIKCKKKATTETAVFLDNELYDYGNRWMIVITCDDHKPKP